MIHQTRSTFLKITDPVISRLFSLSILLTKRVSSVRTLCILKVCLAFQYGMLVICIGYWQMPQQTDETQN